MIQKVSNRNKSLEECPLVSVLVISYNSEDTILETLNSIKNQTYPKLELVISDDASHDSTVSVCKEWLKDQGKRFVNIILLESSVNQGIPANYNKAENACSGEWIKNINADDYLLPNCIETFVDYVMHDNDAVYVFSNICVIGLNRKECDYFERIFEGRNQDLLQKSCEEQLEYICTGDCPPAPGCFYNRVRAMSLGINSDERIKSFEDWPKWVDVLRCGIKFKFIEKKLVVFRLGGISSSEKWQSMSSFLSRRMTYFYHIFPWRYNQDPQRTIESLLDYEQKLYEDYLKAMASLKRIHNNPIYKVARTLIKPFV